MESVAERCGRDAPHSETGALGLGQRLTIPVDANVVRAADLLFGSLQ